MNTAASNVEEMSKILKRIIDSQEPTTLWSSMNPYLMEYPDLFFGVIDLRYLGKKRLESLYTAMAYEQNDKGENSTQKLVYNHIKRKLVKVDTLIYSIGYEAMEIDKFIEKLKRNKINLLIDVREKAISRKKGFSKAALESVLTEAGIQYVHMKQLGSPSEDRKKLHENDNWEEFTRKYRQYMEGNMTSLVELCNKVKGKVSCLMCFEREYSKCHRSLLTSKIKEISGIEAVHL